MKFVRRSASQVVGTTPFDFEGDRIPVTVSLGVATIVNEIACRARSSRCADDNLYKAKRTGRNRVVG